MTPTTNNKPCAQHTETSGSQPGHISRTVTQALWASGTKRARALWAPGTERDRALWAHGTERALELTLP